MLKLQTVDKIITPITVTIVFFTVPPFSHTLLQCPYELEELVQKKKQKHSSRAENVYTKRTIGWESVHVCVNEFQQFIDAAGPRARQVGASMNC